MRRLVLGQLNGGLIRMPEFALLLRAGGLSADSINKFIRLDIVSKCQ